MYCYVFGVFFTYLVLSNAIKESIITHNKIENKVVVKQPNEDAILLYQIEEVPDTVTFKTGDTLYKTLRMSNEQALEFAKRFKKKYWYKNGLLYVLVREGDQFVKDWRPLEKVPVVQRNYLWMKNLRYDRMKSF